MSDYQIYEDTAGNQFKVVDGRYHICKKGVGWVEFMGKTTLTNGFIVDQSVQNDEEVQQQAEQVSIENDLFRHIAVSLFVQSENQGAALACAEAQQMLDELKKRGRL